MTETTDTRTLHVDRSTSTAHRLSRYDGACANLHGHNMVWKGEVDVDMNVSGRDNMPLDLKDVSGEIDAVDHALILSKEDALLETLLPGEHEIFQLDQSEPFIGEYNIPELGPTFVFSGDPTCEVLSQWMADRIQDIDGVVDVSITVHETAKYGIETQSRR